MNQRESAPTFKNRLIQILRYLQIILYLAFVFLWFKDSFTIFKKVNLSYLLALIPLIIVTAIRILFRFRERKIRLRLRFDKVFMALVVLVLIATAIRIPFLVYSFGQMNSDDAVSLLIAKHISEGKIPPVYHYGVNYLGTLTYHIYALIFRIIGYSIFIPVLTCFIFYLCFIIIQFVFFKEMFSSHNLSFILSFFYCLPIANLFAISFSVGTNFGFVLFLCSLSMYLSFLVYKKHKRGLIPLIGFCLGLSFWTQPITIYFIVCSFIFIALELRLMWKKYIGLMIYFLIGGFPFVLFQISRKSGTFGYLFSGTKIRGLPFEKAKEIIGHIVYILTSGEKIFFLHIYIFFIFAGMIGIIYLSIKKKKFLPESIFVIFFVLFLLIYTFSKFSADILFVRYLYPLYFALPFLLVAIFNLIRRKIKFVLMLTMFLIIFFSNIKATYTSYLSVKRAHLNLKNIISAMERTGEKYWIGDFWQATLITGLSGEKIIGHSFSREYYSPYALWYFNQGNNNNYVFFKEAASFSIKYDELGQHIAGNLDRYFNDQSRNLIDLLEKLNVRTKKQMIGDTCWLIYDLSSQVFPRAIEAPIPKQIPELALTNIEYSRGKLFLTFKNKVLSDSSGFRIHLEIPGYSSHVRGFASDEKELNLRIPFPRRKSFLLRYYLDYMGTQIPATIQRLSCLPLPEVLDERRPRIVYLSGFGPLMEVSDEKQRICEKKVAFEINQILGKTHRISVHLFSPFEFSHPWWYGVYSQRVKIYLNDQYLMEERIEDGKNVIEFEIKAPHFKNRSNIITLKFKYHLPFEFAPLWKTSALLGRIEIKPN